MFNLEGAYAYYIGIGFFALAGLCLLYYCCIRARIHFASQCVTAAMRARAAAGGVVATARASLWFVCVCVG